jgi:hypothetical protein
MVCTATNVKSLIDAASLEFVGALTDVLPQFCYVEANHEQSLT